MFLRTNPLGCAAPFVPQRIRSLLYGRTLTRVKRSHLTGLRPRSPSSTLRSKNQTFIAPDPTSTKEMIHCDTCKCASKNSLPNCRRGTKEEGEKVPVWSPEKRSSRTGSKSIHLNGKSRSSFVHRENLVSTTPPR